MFKHILVPVDLSDRQGRMLKTACELASDNGARVTLLHVVQRVAALAPRELRGFYQRLVKTSQRRLTLAAKPFVARGISVRVEVLIGEPVAEILRLAVVREADLVIMGSHKVSADRRSRGWGTISYRVGLLCQCPILLVK
jgi:nucleotide-binding universal stress UspA family protein